MFMMMPAAIISDGYTVVEPIRPAPHAHVRDVLAGAASEKTRNRLRDAAPPRRHDAEHDDSLKDTPRSRRPAFQHISRAEKIAAADDAAERDHLQILFFNPLLICPIHGLVPDLLV